MFLTRSRCRAVGGRVYPNFCKHFSRRNSNEAGRQIAAVANLLDFNEFGRLQAAQFFDEGLHERRPMPRGVRGSIPRKP
jgi:hypothetical protein